MTGTALLITAGPTHEPIDAVRYLANRSSGRLGIALAKAATRRGFRTTLLLGPTPLPPPCPAGGSQPTTVRFQTTADLEALLAAHWPDHDVLIMAAAVGDYRPAHPEPSGKRPRRGTWSLELEATPDLVKKLAAGSRPDQTLIGFALEPADRLPDEARRKLSDKGLSAIVANPLETMGRDEIRATLLLPDGRTLAPSGGACSKRDFAAWLLDQLGKVEMSKSRTVKK